MTVGKLIELLQQFDPALEVWIFDGEPEPLEISYVHDGELDGVWVDTECDGPYTGKEKKVCQIGIVY